MWCELYFDGASLGNPGPAGYGYVIRCGKSVYKVSGYIGEATYNVVLRKPSSRGSRDASSSDAGSS